MAESKNQKKKQKSESFADDLDSMLNLDATSEQQVELIDDDDAIDRLLMVDAFEEPNDDETESGDISELLDEDADKIDKSMIDLDEFGDDSDYFIPDFQLKTDTNKSDSGEEQTFSDESEFEIHAEPAESNEVEALDEFDQFADEAPAMPGLTTESESVDHKELESMTEIDEFEIADNEPIGTEHTDFLIADFDISADGDDMPHEHQINPSQSEIAELDEEARSESNDESGDDGSVTQSSDLAPDDSDEIARRSDDGDSDIDVGGKAVELDDPAARFNEKLAEVYAGLDGLAKQQTHLEQEIQQKGNQDNLIECLERLDFLKTEQQKVKRNVDGLLNQRPVSAYLAIGIAIIALIVGGGLGFQGYIAKRQLAEVAEFIGKMREQINAAPVAEVAEKELLRKRLDELATANSATANQVAELIKSIQGDGDNAGGGVMQQLKTLNDRNKEMGAVLSALQNKVTSLDKGKSADRAKAAVNKRAIPQQAWVVNLVAYKQDWYASRKAEEFGAKGIPAKVQKVMSKGEQWYRLVVDGFESQGEASAYATRAKKTLNLDSVWVAKK
ncbi:SPOR domain-containing protein [Methylomonas sp. MgM2]